MRSSQLIVMAALPLGVALSCADRPQPSDERCFYEDPGYWIDSGVTRFCDDINRQIPEGPPGTERGTVMIPTPPDADGRCDECPDPEFDEELRQGARESAYGCTAENTEIVELQRECVSTPEQTGGYCAYRARFWFVCHDSV